MNLRRTCKAFDNAQPSIAFGRHSAKLLTAAIAFILMTGIGGAQSSSGVHSVGTTFKDDQGRTLILRGVNLSGTSKTPAKTSSDPRAVSFVGRPFPLTEADEHFRRLQSWGLTFAGLQCPSGHFVFGIGETNKSLDDAATIGARYIISTIMPPRPLTTGAGFMEQLNHLESDDFKRMAAKANEIGKAAHERGLQYAYHNHNVEFRTFEDGVTGYSILMKETDPELVKFEADLGWMVTAGADPLAIIKSAPQRFPLLHFKDFSALNPPVIELGTDRQKQIVDLGQGLVPFKHFVSQGKKTGVERYIVDHDPPFKNQTALEAAKIDFDYLAGLLAS